MSRLILAFAVLAPTAAWPCSLFRPDSAPRFEGRVFSGTPLLFAGGFGEPSTKLFRTGGVEVVEIPLVVEPHPELGPVLDFGAPATAFRPSSPLIEGSYSLGSRSFSISASGLDVRAIPDPGAAELSLSIYEGDCGASTLNVRPSIPAPDSAYLVVATAADGRVASRLGIGTLDGSFFLTGFDEFPFDSTRFCVKISGLSADGTLGNERDLKCIDPSDGDDTRVTFSNDGGVFSCASTPGAANPLWIVLLYAAARRFSSSRAKAM